MGIELASTDLFVVPALLALLACYRLRRRLGRTLLGIVVPLVSLLVVAFAGYWLWYSHRPQPSASSREITTGIRYQCIVRSSPRPLVIHILRIDLDTPGLEFVVTPAEPVGGFDLPARTTSQFVRDFDVMAAINANYFYPFEANSPFDYYPRVGEPVNVVGSCASAGNWYSSPVADYTLLSITRDNHASIGKPTGLVWNAVSGQPVLLKEGEPTLLDEEELNPRTAVAIDREGRQMIWVVVDGRQPRYSEGMSLKELSRLLIELGGWNALALDGGGSATMGIREANGDPRILNCPIHGKHPPGVERPVANHLGVRIKP